MAPHLKLTEIEAQRDENIRRLIQDLDDDNFFTRENASKELRELGQMAVPALKAELKQKPPLEVAARIKSLLKVSDRSVRTLPVEALRRIRAIEVLENVGTDRAQEVLEQLAKGPKSTQEAHEATLALK